jgi:hypothetical protein
VFNFQAIKVRAQDVINKEYHKITTADNTTKYRYMRIKTGIEGQITAT